MKLLLTILACLVAASAGAQTIKSLGVNTTNGQIVLTNANTVFPINNSLSFVQPEDTAAVLTFTDGSDVVLREINWNNPGVRSALGLGIGDNVEFREVRFGYGILQDFGLRALAGQISGYSTNTNNAYTNLIIDLGGGTVGEAITAHRQIAFNNTTNAATTRTNLGLGATNNVTFSNLTLSGVNNTASNQVASSAGSLITRDLIYQSQMDFNSGDMIAPIAAQQTGTGASASGFATIGYGVQITTNTNTSAGAYSGDMLWSQSSYSGSPMPANKAIDYTLKGVMLRVETNANFVNRIVFGVGAPTRTIPAAGTPAATNQSWGVNFFYDGTNQVAQPFWYTTNYNTAANIILTNLSDLSWTARVYTMRFQQTTNGQISFYINNGLAVRLSSTATWTTNVTWPSVNYAGRFIGMECASATNAAPIAGSRMHYRNAYIKYDP